MNRHEHRCFFTRVMALRYPLAPAIFLICQIWILIKKLVIFKYYAGGMKISAFDTHAAGIKNAEQR